MKILFLTNLLPYPLDNGGKIKTFTTIKSLKEANYDIDLLCFSETHQSDQKSLDVLNQYCHSIQQVYLRLTTADNIQYMMKMAIKSLFSSYSFGLYKYQSSQMTKLLETQIQHNQYDCIYFDHLQMCMYYPLIKKLMPHTKMILDEHNCEALIMKRNGDLAHNPLKKLFLKLEAKKLATFEMKMLKKMDGNIILSKEDYLELKKQCHGDFEHTIIPIGVQDHGEKKIRNQDNDLNILFVGTLTWAPNNQGILWFLKEVLPLLNDIPYKLYIVGKNPSQEVQDIANDYSQVTITGYVDSVDEYYDLCDCMVVPLFIGSGQRVKIIEGFSKAMPMISTSVGAEGLAYQDGQNILIANTNDEFKKAIDKMRSEELREHIASLSRQTYIAHYSPETLSKRIIEYINNVLGGERYE